MAYWEENKELLLRVFPARILSGESSSPCHFNNTSVAAAHLGYGIYFILLRYQAYGGSFEHSLDGGCDLHTHIQHRNVFAC
jgi:hypothetical protein